MNELQHDNKSTLPLLAIVYFPALNSDSSMPTVSSLQVGLLVLDLLHYRYGIRPTPTVFQFFLKDKSIGRLLPQHRPNFHYE